MPILTGDFGDLIAGAAVNATVTAYVETNVEANHGLVDTTNNMIRLGKRYPLSTTDGAFSVDLPSTDATDLGLPAGQLQYQVVATFTDPGSKGKDVWRSGWFFHTAAGDLSDKATSPTTTPPAATTDSTVAPLVAAGSTSTTMTNLKETFAQSKSGEPGAELVTNGTFDTSLTGWAGANWAWVTGAAKHTAGSTIALTQAALVPTKGTTYAYSFTVSGATAGWVTLQLGGATRASNGDGTFTGYITATTTAALSLIPESVFDGSVDLVSIKALPVGASGTFANPILLHSGRVNLPAGAHVAIGYEALENVSSTGGTYALSSSNVAIGYRAGRNTTTGHVTAVGYRAAEANTGDGVVTAFGKWAGLSSTTGHSTFFGNAAGRSATTGNVDVFGDEAAANTTTGTGVAAFGYYAANGNVTGTVTAFGHKAGMACGPAADFTAVGWEAIVNGTATGGAVAIGSRACSVVSTARAVGVGYNALSTLTTGNATAVGWKAGLQATTSPGTFLGYQAGYSTTTGRVTAVGSSAALDFTTGTGVFVGHQAGYGLTPANAPKTDAQAVLIGDYANRSVASATYLENYVGLGYNALVGGSRATALGANSHAAHTDSVALGESSVTTAANQVMVGNRDIESTRTAGGIVLKSPDGTRYKLTIANGGTVAVAAA